MTVAFAEAWASPLGLIINVLVHVIAFRNIASLGLLRSLLLGFTVGLSFIGAVECFYYFLLFRNWPDFVSVVAANLIAYASLSYCYFNFINLGETARRIRIMRELYDAAEGLCLPDILLKYNAREIVSRRIGRLIKNRQIVEKSGRYFLGKPTLLFIARTIVLLKVMFLGKKSEFN